MRTLIVTLLFGGNFPTERSASDERCPDCNAFDGGMPCVAQSPLKLAF